MHERYSYQDLQQLLGLPKRTPRFWITQELASPPELRVGRRKYFSHNQYQEFLALSRLLKEFHLSLGVVRTLKHLVMEELHYSDAAKSYPFSVLMRVMGEVAERDGTTIKYLLHHLINGGQYLDCCKAQGFYLFRDTAGVEVDAKDAMGSYCRLDDLVKHLQSHAYRTHGQTVMQSKVDVGFVKRFIKKEILPEPRYRSGNELLFSYHDRDTAKTWLDLFWALGRPQLSFLHRLKKAVQGDIVQAFPYPLHQHFSSAIDRYHTEAYMLHAVLKLVSGEVCVLNVLNHPDRGPSLAFVEHYIDGFYIISPNYLRVPSMPMMGAPLLIKTPLSELNPEQLKKAERLGLYSTEEVAVEAERRIKQHGEDVKFLRYKVLKNLKRRKR